MADRIATAVAILGLGLLISSVLVDYLPEARPGFNSFQLLLLIAGLVVTPAGIYLRRARVRSGMFMRIRKNLLASVIVTIISLVVLELLLAMIGAPTHYPTEIPAVEYEAAPWWTCDEAGCHYVAEHMHEVCEPSAVSIWTCEINAQGFHDSQDFVASDDLASRLRILAMGDSFTFGLSADEGKSYVDSIELNVPNSIVWNTGISGTGTEQALASFRAFGPVMMPQISIYGYFVTDFDDNLLPIDGYFAGVDEDGRPIGIRKHQVDQWGNLVKLDQSTAKYYLEHGIYPPRSPVEHLMGKTRLGSLVLNAYRTIVHGSGLSLRVINEKRLASTRKMLTDLRNEAKALDTRLLILMIPRKEDLLYGPGYKYRTAIELFNELSITYMNLIDVLNVGSDYAPEGDGHWNTAGHQKIGMILSNCLKTYLDSEDFSGCDLVATP